MPSQIGCGSNIIFFQPTLETDGSAVSCHQACADRFRGHRWGRPDGRWSVGHAGGGGKGEVIGDQ